MDDFINIYKEKVFSLLDSDPFFKSALMSLLFVRIHPFSDGNGRTSRLIYDMKFTEMVNSLFGTRLKISPLHLSNSIYVNQISYAKAINNIYFDMEHDSNDEINKWFDFMLNMTDEQLNYMTSYNSKSNLDKLGKIFITNDEYVPNDIDAQSMRLNKLKQEKSK